MKIWNYCEKSGLIKQSVKYSILVWFTLCAKNEKLGAITVLVSLMFSAHDSVKSDTDSCHLTGEDTPYNLG